MSFEVISVSGLSRIALNPLPNADFLVFIDRWDLFLRFPDVGHPVLLQDLPGQVEVVDGPGAAGIVHDDGLAVAWCLAQLGVAVDDGIEDHLLEMGLDLLHDLLGEPQPLVVHGEEDPFNVEVRVQP